MLIYKTN